MPEAAQPILSLKNLYRLLTRKDFPKPSYAVFPEGALQGQTLSRFWLSLLREALPSSIDLTILETDTHRSRSLTRLLNNTGSGNFLSHWYESFTPFLQPEGLLKLILVWSDRLTAWHYDAQSLTDKLDAYIASLSLNAELEGFFRNLLSLLGDTGTLPLSFLHGTVLSWLTLYALFGGRMTDARLTKLRLGTGTSPQGLHALRRSQIGMRDVRVITGRDCLLCVQPLMKSAFFGRKNEMDTALAIMEKRGKLVVSGMGGIGKTEFTRQLLEKLTEEEKYARVAFVQYEESLENSFLSAFPFLRETEAGKRIQRAREELEAEEAGKTLLLIDNVNALPSKDTALGKLSTYGCDVIVTTRLCGIDGFNVLPLKGLEDMDVPLLLSYYDQGGKASPSEIEELCRYTVGHPLALVLFARMCRKRFWPLGTLLEHIRMEGITGLSYVHQASAENLSDIFARTFAADSLSAQQKRLMQLLSLFPNIYYLPEKLIDYTCDIFDCAESLSVSCQILYDSGWLLMGSEGYTVHPLIGETIRLTPLAADEFPKLCEALLEKAGSGDAIADRIVYSLTLQLQHLNQVFIRALSKLEQALGSTAYVTLPDACYAIHRAFLDEGLGDEGDEADYWISLGIRDIVEKSTRENLNGYLRHILDLKGFPACIRDRGSLYTVLEYASSARESESAEDMFRRLRPEDETSSETARFLIAYSVFEQRHLADPLLAAASLRSAEEILRASGLTQSIQYSNLCYRLGVCMLDVGRPEEAGMRLKTCLEILKSLRYEDTAQKVMATRNTYGVALMQAEAWEEAFAEFRLLEAQYIALHRTKSAEFAYLLNNTAVLLCGMQRLDEAEKTILRVLELDEGLEIPEDTRATHLRNAADILWREEQYAKAFPLAKKAMDMRQKRFGEDSPWSADTRAVYAGVLAGMGEIEKASGMIDAACALLVRVWGEGHRKSRSALEVKRKIQSLQG